MRSRPGAAERTGSPERAKREPMPVASRADLHRVFDQHVQATPTPTRRIRFVKDYSWESAQAARRARGDVSRVTEREKRATTKATTKATMKATIERRIERPDETGQRAQPRIAPAAIVSAPPSASGASGSVAPATSGATQSVKSDDEVCRETFSSGVADDVAQAASLSFHESMAAHSRAYLIRLLTAAGGERRLAAEIAGLGRTHLQALVKRFGVAAAVPANLKLRGRPRAQRPI